MLTFLLTLLVAGLILLCGGATELFASAMSDQPEDDNRLAVFAFWMGLAMAACALAGLIVLVVGLLFGLLAGPWQ